MIPIGDSPRSHSFPIITVLLILANLAVFIYMLSLDSSLPATAAAARSDFVTQTESICYGFEARPTEVDRFYCRWSFQPREWFDAVRDTPSVADFDRVEVLFSILTSMFMHAGWLHIIGNMLFLWVFGDNLEDRLGKVGFLLFYLASGVIAALVQGAVDPNSLVPTVGASGAVAGVLGGYIVLFPTAFVTVLIPFFPLIFFPIPIPAIIMIGVWFAQNLLAGFATLGTVGAPDGGVAWFAHIGGFLFGALTLLLLRAMLPERRPPRPPRGQWGR